MKCRQIRLGPPLNLFVGTGWHPGDTSSLSLKHPTLGNLGNLAHSTFLRFIALDMLRSEQKEGNQGVIRKNAEQSSAKILLLRCSSWYLLIHVHAGQCVKFALVQGSKITLGIGCLCHLRPLTRVFNVFPCPEDNIWWQRYRRTQLPIAVQTR